MASLKKYVVVKFSDDETTSEVPSNWLHRSNYCWWPTTKNVTSLILKRVEHDPRSANWKLYPVDILFECDDLNDARNKALDLKPEPSQELDSDTQQDKKRKCSEDDVSVKTEILSDEIFDEIIASDSDYESLNRLEKGRQEKKKKLTETDNGSNSAGCNLIADANIKVEDLHDEDTPVLDPTRYSSAGIRVNANTLYSLRQMPNISELQRYMDLKFIQFFNTLSKIESAVQSIEKKMEDKSGEYPDISNFPSKIRDLIPIQNLEALQKIDEQCGDTKNGLFGIFVAYFKTLGGNNLKEKIVRILRKTFSNAVIAQASWQGRGNNFRMQNLNLITIIKDSVCISSDYSEKLFEDITSRWIRQGKQRFERERNKTNH